jgi:hypothetical protein
MDAFLSKSQKLARRRGPSPRFIFLLIGFADLVQLRRMVAQWFYSLVRRKGRNHDSSLTAPEGFPACAKSNGSLA